MSLEGELRIGLRAAGGRVTRVRIQSTRPEVARSLLQGRTRAEVAAAVPLLFSICSRSQAAASELACTAAAGDEPTPAALARFAAGVSAEIVRECAWRTLLDWPQWLGESPAADAVAAARGSLAFNAGATTCEVAEAIAQAAFGVGASEWLALQSVADLDRWADAGRTASARFIRRVRDDEDNAASHGDRSPDVPLLQTPLDAVSLAELAQACDTDPEFSRHPTWRGTPAETGALARLRSDPLIGELAQRSGSRVPARFVARLRELALLLAGRSSVAVGVQAGAPGTGVGWVENARGLLVHCVQLDGTVVRSYRIVAPTEWNFHPDGALARALLDHPAADRDALERRATRLVHSLDPCVASRVEFDDA